MHENIVEIKEEPVPTEEALKLVLSANGEGVYASGDTLFNGATFGRDSLEVAEDILEVKPELTRSILLQLAALQGTAYSSLREERPGKIVHEHRVDPLLSGTSSDVTQRVFEDVYKNFGGEGSEVRYYGSIDATPLFIRTLARYCQIYGVQILDEVIVKNDGSISTMYDCLHAATSCIVEEIKASPFGLLSFSHVNPTGKLCQAWKDSDEFTTHLTGETANYEDHIVSIEVQGLAYDALTLAAEFFPEDAAELITCAANLQSKTLDSMWNEQEQYFALGLDTDKNGHPRKIDTITANPAELLDTTIFDSLPESDRRKYISGIIKTIFSSDFLTDAGVRSRAVRHANVVPFWDYQGSYTTWPKETFDIARGLRKQGFSKLASQLETRLLNAVKQTGGFPEFIYVDLQGRVLYGPEANQSQAGNLILIDNVDRPENMQAWTISAVIGAERAQQMSWEAAMAEWQLKLQTELQVSIPHVPLLNKYEIESQYPYYPYRRAGKPRASSNFFYQHADPATELIAG